MAINTASKQIKNSANETASKAASKQ